MKHTLDPDCPCGLCDRNRFEHRAVLLVFLGLTAIVALGWLAVTL